MSVLSALVWGAGQWLVAAAGLAVALLVLLAWGYRHTRFAGGAVRGVAFTLKAVAVLLLAACLLEPLFSGQRARPGANQFLLLADNSRSMTLRDPGADQSRGDQIKALAPRDAGWLNRLAQDFDLRQYAFDTQLRAVTGLDELTLDGGASNLSASLDRLARRYQGRPLAGVLLFSDGNATDAIERVLARAKVGGPNAARLPPIYPVIAGSREAAADINLRQVAVSQTNFEDAPVTLTAHVAGTKEFAGRDASAELLDESGRVLEKQTVRLSGDGEPAAVRFKVKPEQPGVSFYRVRVGLPGQAFPAGTQPSEASATQPAPKGGEATLANNARVIAVDRGQGPYRVLYVAGRPNWEYKFLSRAVAEDRQVQLVGLLRIAKREPKFAFIGRGGDSANPLFKGFDNADKDQVAEYDQPVLVRINTEDGQELRGGFPKSAEELYRYHAVILDDVESEFFTQDQMQLLKEFVRQRGGGLLMLGGQESFRNGRYDRTPIGDILPVYADDTGPDAPAGEVKYRLALTREGWLEPWVRLRGEEPDERARVEAMPAFQTLNGVRGIKPGATVLARAAVDGADDGTSTVPALVEQRFGQGRVAALLIGDLWRWGLRRADDKDDDLPKAWRQTVRWLVADVPKRVEVTPVTGAGITTDDAATDGGGGADAWAVTLRVQVRDAAYAPLDNSTVKVRVTGPDGKPVDLTGEPSDRERGVYSVTYVPRLAGAYRAAVTATAADASDVGAAQTGWTSDPAADEFATLPPNVALLERLARETGGQVVDPAAIDAFVASLPTRHAEITEPYVQPVWHSPWVFLVAIACLAGEWGLRRWRGLP